MMTPGSHACHACLHLELLIMAAPSDVSTALCPLGTVSARTSAE